MPLPRNILLWIVAWGSIGAVFWFGGDLLADIRSPLAAAGLFLWLLAVILWCVFGVVEEADHLAELLGEPLGTLILTLSVVGIEVALIGAVMLGAHAAPTLGRDTMFAVLMIILNGVVGLALLLGGLRHGQQSYNLQGASAYIAVILTLSVVALILPDFTQSTADASLTKIQAFFFSLFAVLLYGVFLTVQTILHRHFFVEPHLVESPDAASDSFAREPRSAATIGRHILFLLLTLLPVVLLAKSIAKLIDYGIVATHAPTALGGLLIAAIVFMPEGMSALKAALANQLQRAVNLCLGSAASTIGLTVPAVLAIGLLSGRPVILGVDNVGMVLLVITMALNLITFGGPSTTILTGMVHLVVFFVYIVLIFSP